MSLNGLKDLIFMKMEPSYLIMELVKYITFYYIRVLNVFISNLPKNTDLISRCIFDTKIGLKVISLLYLRKLLYSGYDLIIIHHLST